MVFPKKFRIFGYFYAIVGTIVYFLCVTFNKVIHIAVDAPYPSQEAYSLEIQPGSPLGLISFVILWVGIHKNSLTLVQMYRAYLKVSSTVTLVRVVTSRSVSNIFIMLSNDSMVLLNVLVLLLVLIPLLIGFYKLFMWIVNGVIDVIKSEQEGNEAAFI